MFFFLLLIEARVYLYLYLALCQRRAECGARRDILEIVFGGKRDTFFQLYQLYRFPDL
jgi:hypothetical protein